MDSFLGLCVFAMNNEDKMQGAPMIILPVLLLIEGILTMLVFAEIIYAIIQAIKSKDIGNNKAIYIICLYFFNVIYIPCFIMRHIHNDKKATMKNIIYVCAIVVLLVFLAIFSTKLAVIRQ